MSSCHHVTFCYAIKMDTEHMECFSMPSYILLKFWLQIYIMTKNVTMLPTGRSDNFPGHICTDSNHNSPSLMGSGTLGGLKNVKNHSPARFNRHGCQHITHLGAHFFTSTIVSMSISLNRWCYYSDLPLPRIRCDNKQKQKM